MTSLSIQPTKTRSSLATDCPNSKLAVVPRQSYRNRHAIAIAKSIRGNRLFSLVHGPTGMDGENRTWGSSPIVHGSSIIGRIEGAACEGRTSVNPTPRKIRELIRDLERASFAIRDGIGSHCNHEHPTGARVTISGQPR